MVKRLLFLTITLFFIQITVVFSQITIGTVNAGPYTPGSSIAATFTIGSTCIKPGNTFNLYLINPDGTEVPTRIGFYNGFYSTFVNGIIPAGTLAGTGYKLRIKSTLPALLSTDSAPFEITSGSPVRAEVTSFPDLAFDEAGKAEVFGYCPGRDNVEFSFTNASTPTSIVTGTIKNEITGASEAPLAFGTPPDPSFMARLGHYTVLITARLNGTVGTRAYLIVNNNINNSFGTTGSNIVCLPGGYLQYSVDLTEVGIKNNFPGTTYQIKWGDNDGTPEILTICDLAAGYVRHEYTRSSCNQPVYNTGNGNQYNVFGINISAVSPFCPSAGAGLSTFVRVVTKPENRFTSPITACTGSTVSFTNTSIAGQTEANTPNCTDNNIRYNWYVNNVRLATNQPSTYVFTHQFNTADVYTIKLESVITGQCNAPPVTQQICIQDKPVPSFNFGAQATTGCAPFSIKPINTSQLNILCDNNLTYNWIVSPATGVTFTNSNTEAEPTIRFANPGTYEIILEIQTASCGAIRTQIPQKIILADGPATAALSPNITLCALKTLDFNTLIGPTKTEFTGTQVDLPDTYTWSITTPTGGPLDPVNDYSFVNGTNKNTRYPSIQFKRFIPYKISVIHKNTCTTADASQIITFSSAPEPEIDPVPKVCYNTSAGLNARVSGGTYVDFVWSTTGDGTFTNSNTLTPTYNPGPNDLTLLKATVTLTLNTGIDGNCKFVPVSTDIEIYPNNTGTNATQTICTGSAATLTLISTVPGSSFSWSATNPDGNAAAFTTSGTTDINQIINNTNSTQNTVIVYTITPTSNGCPGVPFTFTATVTPKPDISTPIPTKTICHGQPVDISVTSNNIPSQFKWTSVAEPGVTGNTNPSALSASLGTIIISDVLLNSTFLPKTVTYTITSYSPGSCEGNTITVVVTVDPKVTQANAGPDESICATNPSNTYTLKGNNPDVGTGQWRLVSTHAVAPIITAPNNFETTVTGLVAGQPYTFEWAITGSGACAATKDEVNITVTPIPVISAPVTDKTICQNNPAAIIVNSDIPTRFIWTSVSSSPGITGHSNPSTLSATANTITIPDVLLNSDFVQGTVTYTIKSFSATGCEGNTITVIVKVDPAVTQANAGPDDSICPTNVYNLKGNKPDVGTGLWRLISTHAVTPAITVPTDFETSVSGLVPGETYTFEWSITGTGQCANTNDLVVIKVNVPTVPGTTATAQQLVCQNNNTGTITLSGNTGSVIAWQSSPDGLAWTNIPGNNTGLTYTFTNLIATTQFRAVVQNGGCTIEHSTPTSITVSPATTIADAGTDQILCNEASVLLKGNLVAAGETGIWTMVTGNANVIITSGANSEATVSNLAPGVTYVFRWTITGNSPCGPTFEDITIRNNAPIGLNSITTNAVVCNSQQITINGSTPTGGAENGQYNYVWESQVNGGQWAVIPGETAEDLTATLTTTGIVSFRRTVNSGTCTLISNEFPITVQPPITGNTISADQAICSGLTPALITGSLPTGGNDQFIYQWQSSPNGTAWTNIGGAMSQNYQPPSLTETIYYRRIVSTVECSGNLQSISTAVKVTVTPNAKAEFTWGTEDKGCVPYTLPIQVVTYPDRNATYTWYANNLILPSTGSAFPGYVIQNSGQTVTIKLVVTSSLGCSTNEFEHEFSTNQAVPASFTQSATEGCGPLSVNFTNTSLLTAGATFKWDFGNGKTSTNIHPTGIIFDQDPTGKDTTYVVTLTSTTSCGPNSVTSTVLVKAKPIAKFSPSKTEGCSPMLVNFTNTSPGGTNKYYYDFGDGSAIIERTNKLPVTHTYNTTVTKDFTVTMTAENECGTDVKTYVIRVYPQNMTPELVVNGNQNTGCAPFTVNFDNNTIGASRFTFDFGDGGTRNTITAGTEKYTFTKPGVYTVRMTAYNSCSELFEEETITVLEQPIPHFTSDVRLGCADLAVKFENLTQGGITYVWNFGDGSTSNELHPLHIYKGDQEYYTVTLTATNTNGCSATISRVDYIRVVPPPIAAFNVNPSTLISIPNYTFKFEDESTNGPTIWEWDFGDGMTSSLKNPNHTYLDTGTYKVTLKVTNQQGCFTTTFKNVTIKGVPGYLFVPNSFIPGNPQPELREFRAKGSGIQSWRFSVFNKWGQVLWETTKLEEGRPAEGWDGTFKGEPMPQGVYYWKIDVQMVNGSEWKGMTYDSSPAKRTGPIHLIR